MPKIAKTILIVEDESATRRALREKLTREGFSVLEAKNGKEGLEIALKEKPDLILLDIIMPLMDGITALTNLRKDDWGKDAKIIMLTVLSDAEKVSEALSRGVYDFLVKTDWTLEDVVKKVKERLAIK